ncbi:methyl-accepting chemotaxis protein [Spirulina sp. CS-785/01]|uniref:methyl-accepting chemotaxis protein n=1 Tax=Spirulina sp. CS-785/01 TaxID=3021716 RepID=UPI00232FE195|nr:methyl-accepting chemotaxis protein [Spirulina sp. CS-785/01]MDB9312054.1 methyl-accepting chemotaxis protein [Spirulina sp. CS-785/01]
MNLQPFSSGSLSRVQLLSVPLTLTVALLGGTGWYIGNTYQAFRGIYTQDMRLVELSGEIDYLDEVLTMSARMAVATGDQQWVRRYEEYDPQVFAAIEETAELLPSAFSGQAGEELNDVAVQLQRMEKRAFALLEQGQRQQAEQLLFSASYERQKERYTQVMGDILETLQQHANQSLRVQTRNAQIALWVIGVSVVLLLILWIVILRMLVHSIQSVRQASHSVSQVSQQITHTVAEQETLVVDQAGAVSQTSTTMNELEQSAKASAEGMQVALDEAKQALNLAEKGTETVDKTLASMEHLQQKVQDISQQTQQLINHSQEIGTVSQLVSELANQTNLLALNAAVEAVRAGESGQGFAVVASEIRKLADRSKDSAQKISNLVLDIQSSVHGTADVTQEGTKTVNQGIDLTHQTAKTFEQFVAAIEQITTNSQQISLTAKQQSQATQEVAEALESLDQGTERTKTVISETKTATDYLKETAEELLKLV